MITENGVLELLVRADPAPEDATYRTIEGRTYLSAVQLRTNAVYETEKPPTELPERHRWRNYWLAIAASVAVVVAAALVLLLPTQAEDAPVATTPEISEPEPVPSTEPEAVVEPEPTTPSTTPEDFPSNESEAVSVSGLPIFEGAPPAGDYEAVGENLRILFTSDGQWRDCVRPYCNVHGGIEIQPTELLSVYGWVEPIEVSIDEFHAGLSETPDLIVGDIEPFAPTHPEANWTGFRFTVDVDPAAGRDRTCESGGLDGPPYPCVVVPILSPFFVNEEIEMVPIDLAIHGPTLFHILTRPDGSSVWAAPIWYPYPQVPEGAYEAINDRFFELVQTIRFGD